MNSFWLRLTSYILTAIVAAGIGAFLVSTSPPEPLDGLTSALTEEERNDTFLSAIQDLACLGIEQAAGMGGSLWEESKDACRNFELSARRIPRRPFRDSITTENQLTFLDSTRDRDRLWGIVANGNRSSGTVYEFALACRVSEAANIEGRAKPRWPWQSPTVSWAFVERVAEYRRIQCDAFRTLNLYFSNSIEIARSAYTARLDEISRDWSANDINSGRVSFPEPHQRREAETREPFLTEIEEKGVRGATIAELYCPSTGFFGGSAPKYGFCKWSTQFRFQLQPNRFPKGLDVDSSAMSLFSLHGRLGPLLFYLSRCEVAGYDAKSPRVQSILADRSQGTLAREDMAAFVAGSSVACNVALEAWTSLFARNTQVISLRNSWLTDRAADLIALHKSPDDLHFETITETFGLSADDR